MIKVINYTPNPLTLMGKTASACWDSTPSPQIGIDTIESGHGRVLEFPDIIVEIIGYSTRFARELYTKQVGVTKLQASTRYVQYSEFDYYIPESIKNNPQTLNIYINTMEVISRSYKQLDGYNISKQDIANILPLGMYTKVVLKINARAILDMALTRLCTRALREYRDFMNELINTVSGLDEEWAKIMSYAKPKCEVYGKCTEKHSCGRLKLNEKAKQS